MKHPLLIEKSDLFSLKWKPRLAWLIIGILIGGMVGLYFQECRVRELKAHYETVAPYYKTK